MTEPFRFYSSAKLVELTGRRARDLDELAAGIRELDGSVIFHHTHHFVFQHQYWLPQPPSDFAFWVSEMLQEKQVGDQLASINTVEFGSLRELRNRLLEVLEKHLASAKRSPQATPGLEFYFQRAHTFIFPTAYQAEDLASFAACLEKVSLGSIYHHVFEARLRLDRPTNDFARWFRDSLGQTKLAGQIEQLDPYAYTLDDLREEILARLRRRL